MRPPISRPSRDEKPLGVGVTPSLGGSGHRSRVRGIAPSCLEIKEDVRQEANRHARKKKEKCKQQRLENQGKGGADFMNLESRHTMLKEYHNE